jgi:hypothetical protein
MLGAIYLSVALHEIQEIQIAEMAFKRDVRNRKRKYACGYTYIPMLRWSLSPWHGASLRCGWRRRPPNMEGSCQYIGINTMLSGPLVTITWHVLRLWMEETASRYGG